MLAEDVTVKDGRVNTKDSIMECPHCKSTFQKDHVRTRMRKWGKDSFYSTRHCPNCDKRITLRDDNPDIESINTRLSKLRTYCNYCKMNGQFDEYSDAMGETLELQKQIEDMRNGEMKSKVKDSQIWSKNGIVVNEEEDSEGTYYTVINTKTGEHVGDYDNESLAIAAAKNETSSRDATNWMGERTFQTYEAWKRACKQIDPNVKFDGDIDICQAGKIGEWDGDKGIIYNTKDSKKLMKDAASVALKKLGQVKRQVKDRKTKDDFPVGAKVKYVGKYADPALTNARATIVGAGNDKGVGGGNMVRIRFDNGREAIVPYMDVEHTNDSKKTKDVIPSPKDTYNKIRNFDKIALQGFARRIGYPELSDLKKMDTSSIIAELISFLHGEKGDQFLENPNNFKDSKTTAKDRMLKGLDSLKRRVKDAMKAYYVRFVWNGVEKGQTIYSSELMQYGSDPMEAAQKFMEKLYSPRVKVKSVSASFSGGLNKDAYESFDTRNIEEETIKNNAFRRVVFTGNTLQLVLMSLLPNEDIGMEVHDNVDQFFRIEKGEGLLEIEGQGSQPVKDGFSILITAGTKHNVKNIGSEPLKLYTIYGPPNHPADRVQKTKAEAMAAEKVTKDEGNFLVGKRIIVNAGRFTNAPATVIEIGGQVTHGVNGVYAKMDTGEKVWIARPDFEFKDSKTKDVNPADKIKDLLQNGYSLKDAILKTEKSIGRQLNAFEAAEAVALTKKMKGK